MFELHFYEYLLINLIVILPPLFFTIFHAENTFRRFWFPILISITATGTLFLLWDVYAIAQDHWSFNRNFITGVFVGNLPIEEILFFITIPFACLFLWNEVSQFTSFRDLKNRTINNR